MKRVLRASTNNVIFEDEYFELRKDSGVGMNDTKWEGLKVVSKGAAVDYVVQIRLASKNADFDGTPVKYEYFDSPATVVHGMSLRNETLEDTEEYISILEDAVDFAYRVNDWIRQNPDY